MKHFKAFIILIWIIASIIVFNSSLELMTKPNTVSNLVGLLSILIFVYLSYYTKLGTSILLIINYFKTKKQ